MEDGDVMLSECPLCRWKQPFDFLQYNRTGECVICEKCRRPYKIQSGIVYGVAMTIEEYKEYKFMQELRNSDCDCENCNDCTR